MTIDILAIGVHPDDIELSCSGTLFAHAQKGYTFGLLDLTRGELGTRGSAEQRDIEAANSAAIMGASFRQNLAMADGQFPDDHAHKSQIIEVIRWCKPKLVLANALTDRHPDHGRAAKLIADACYYSGLRKWETKRDGQLQAPHRPDNVLHYIQDYYQTPDVVVDITEHFEQKIECIKAYTSQFFDPTSDEPETPLTGSDYFDFIKSRARDVGRPAGYALAEGYQRSRIYGLNDLLTLD
ncbi:MAG: bacillithiol biosynthesis deacetylase BshB1 [Saprospiraceae bacterium]